MAVKIKQLNDEPIVIASIYEPIDMAVDPVVNRNEANAVARKFSGKVYRITDFTHFRLTFEQLVQGLADDIRYSEPNIVHLFVGSGELLKMQAEAMKQPQYGGKDAKIFATLDEAIAFARAGR